MRVALEEKGLLGPGKHLKELLRILSAVQFIAAVDGEVGDTMYAFPIGVLHFAVHFLAALSLVQPVPDLVLVKPGLLADRDQHALGRDIGVLLKVALEEGRNDSVLDIARFGLG
ncbi:hypothetical protein VTG60DRAFT_1759 [Thermothelomyces hinnuleus]